MLRTTPVSPLRPSLGRMLPRLLVLSLVLAIAPGCTTVKGWFGGNKVKANEPAAKASAPAKKDKTAKKETAKKEEPKKEEAAKK